MYDGRRRGSVDEGRWAMDEGRWTRGGGRRGNAQGAMGGGQSTPDHGGSQPWRAKPIVMSKGTGATSLAMRMGVVQGGRTSWSCPLVEGHGTRGPGPLPWLVLLAALPQMTKVGSEEHRQASTAISVVSIVGVVIHESVFLNY